MNIIFVLIPLSLLLLAFAVWAFFWAVRTRQFENMEVEAWRILMDDDRAPPGPHRASAVPSPAPAQTGQQAPTDACGAAAGPAPASGDHTLVPGVAHAGGARRGPDARDRHDGRAEHMRSERRVGALQRECEQRPRRPDRCQ